MRRTHRAIAQLCESGKRRKHNFHRDENRPPFFWQDNHGKEIDCLLVNGNKTTPTGGNWRRFLKIKAMWFMEESSPCRLGLSHSSVGESWSVFQINELPNRLHRHVHA
jgi:hypothetical protein